jgi:hypothetical protein
MPANLPAVPLQPPLPSMAGTGQGAPAAHANAQESVAAQAEQLVLQYQNNPFQLSAALAQLKAKYIAQHYHISPNSADK